MPSNIELVELHRLARDKGRAFPRKRELFDSVRTSRGKTFIGVVGPRGVGKTVLLQQLASLDDQSLYLSADTLEGEDLFDVVKGLHSDFEFETFLVDEIHFHEGYTSALKKIYDFLDVRIVFSSSVSLSLFDSAQDLSRRVRMLSLLPFSFREYLAFTKDQDLPRISLDDIVERRWSREHLLAAPNFDKYLRGGLMPFSLEEPDVIRLLENILSRILVRDIPSVARLHVDEISKIDKMVRFIGKAEVDGINYSSIARNVGITKYKAESYVRLLEQAFVLKQVFPAGTNVLREPKVLMSVPYRLLFKEIDDAIGGLREDFFAEMMGMAGIEFQYLKTKRGQKTPDYLIRTDEGELVVEVGGKGKGRSQFKGVSVERKLILAHDGNYDGLRRPLHMLGFIG